MEANLLAEPVRLVAGAKASDHARPSGSETGNGETPIFYSERGLRRTAARALARVLALIASLWLLALILSALGVAPLGELPLPFGLRHSSRQADNHAADRVSAHGELGLPLSLGAAGGSIGGGTAALARAMAAASAARAAPTGVGSQRAAPSSRHASSGSRGGSSQSQSGVGTSHGPAYQPSGEGHGPATTATGQPPVGAPSGTASSGGGRSSRPSYMHAHPAHPAHPTGGPPARVTPHTATPRGRGGPSS